MKRKLIYLILFYLVPSMIYCVIHSKVGGQIRSAINDRSIPYVRIEIIKTGETLLADEKGYFTLRKDANNESLEILISTIGYKEKYVVLDPEVRYNVITLDPKPIIIPGITIKTKKDNVLTLSQANISVILPKNSDDLDTAELIALHADIILEEDAMGEKTIRFMGYETRHVALMIDGVKVNNPAMNSVQSIPLEQIDHIEVLSNNASSSAGNSAMGGAINFVTKKPLGNFSQDVLISAGSWDNYSTNLQTNITLGRLENLINIYGHKAKNDFIYHNRQENNDINRTNNDIVEGSISSKSTLEVGKNISSTLSLQWYNAERGIPGQTTDYMWFENARARASRITFKENLFIESGDNHHEFLLSYQQSNSHYINTIDNPFYEYDSENHSGIFDMTWKFDHLIGSGSSRMKTGFRHEVYSYKDHLNPSQSIHLKVRNNIFASYESSIPIHLLKENISLIPSLRFDKLMQAQSFLSSGLAIEIPHNPDELQVIISAGNAYTIPEFTSLFWKGDSRVQGNPDLKPERSIGGKTSVSWNSHKFSLKLSGSYDCIEDLIYWFRSAMGVWKPENLTDAELYGFSGSVEWSPLEQLSFSVTGSKIFPINKTTDSDHYDKYIPHNPLHKLRPEIKVSLLPIELRLSVTNLGKQYDNFSNTVIVDGYTVCNAVISYHADLSNNYSLQIHTGIRNLFDDSYETSRNIPAPGRSFEFSCKLIFQ